METPSVCWVVFSKIVMVTIISGKLFSPLPLSLLLTFQLHDVFANRPLSSRPDPASYALSDLKQASPGLSFLI